MNHDSLEGHCFPATCRGYDGLDICLPVCYCTREPLVQWHVVIKLGCTSTIVQHIMASWMRSLIPCILREIRVLPCPTIFWLAVNWWSVPCQVVSVSASTQTKTSFHDYQKRQVLCVGFQLPTSQVAVCWAFISIVKRAGPWPSDSQTANPAHFKSVWSTDDHLIRSCELKVRLGPLIFLMGNITLRFPQILLCGIIPQCIVTQSFP